MSWIIDTIQLAKRETVKIAKGVRGSITSTVCRFSQTGISATELQNQLESRARKLASKIGRVSSDTEAVCQEIAETLNGWIHFLHDDSDRFETGVSGDPDSFQYATFREIFFTSQVVEIITFAVLKKPKLLEDIPPPVPPQLEPSQASDSLTTAIRTIREFLTVCFPEVPEWNRLIKTPFCDEQIIMKIISALKPSPDAIHHEDMINLQSLEIDQLSATLFAAGENQADCLLKIAELSVARVESAESLRSAREEVFNTRRKGLEELVRVDLPALQHVLLDRRQAATGRVAELRKSAASLSEDSNLQRSNLEPESQGIHEKLVELQTMADGVKSDILSNERLIAAESEKKVSLKRAIAKKTGASAEEETKVRLKQQEAQAAIHALADRRNVVMSMRAVLEQVTDGLRASFPSKEPRAKEITLEAVVAFLKILSKDVIDDGLGIHDPVEISRSDFATEDWGGFKSNFEEYLAGLSSDERVLVSQLDQRFGLL